MKRFPLSLLLPTILGAVPVAVEAEPMGSFQEPSIRATSGSRYLPGERAKRVTVLNEAYKLQKQADEYLQQGQVGKAVEAYKAAIRLNATAPERWVGMGEALAARGRMAQAVAACRVPLGMASLSDYRKLCDALDLAPGYTVDPNHPEEAPVFNGTTDGVPYLRFAVLLSRLGRFDEAISMYERGAGFLLARRGTLLRFGNGFTPPPLDNDSPFRLLNLRVSPTPLGMKSLQAAAHTLLGKAYRYRDPDKSIAECEDAVALQPRFAAAYLHLGNAYADKQQKVKARAAWEKAAEFGRGEVKALAEKALRH